MDARRVKHFRMFEPKASSKMYRGRHAQPYEIFVGVTFFRLHFLVSKKGSWGSGQRPE